MGAIPKAPPALPRDLVYIALGSLTDTSWYTTQRLGTAMATRHRVLFVDLPATVGEVARRRKNWHVLTQSVLALAPSLLWHCPPYWLPYSRRFHSVDTLNRRYARHRFSAALHQLGMTRPIIWFDDIFRIDYLERCSPALVVYHCLHDFDKLPYLLNSKYTGPQWSQKNVELEMRLLKCADLVLTPSAERAQRFRAVNSNTHVFHMGVEIDRHLAAVADRGSLPDIDALPRPRIGFLGTVGRKKIDFDLLLHAAAARPDWSFVFVGRTFNVGMAVQPLPQHPRFYYLGEKPHEEAPRYLSRFDVSIIPYHRHLIPDLTLKFFEYMAAGHPLVAPDLPQFRDYAPLVYLYDGAASMITAIEAALEERDGSLRQRRTALAADHSFERQVERADALMLQTLIAKTDAPT